MIRRLIVRGADITFDIARPCRVAHLRRLLNPRFSGEETHSTQINQLMLMAQLACSKYIFRARRGHHQMGAGELRTALRKAVKIPSAKVYSEIAAIAKSLSRSQLLP